MGKKLEIIEIKEVFKKAIFRVIEARLRHERYDGSMSPEMTRLSLERGDAVAALIYNPVADTIILIEQFRFPTHEKGDAWLLELPAGIMEKGENPAETMRREIREETGYEVANLKQIFSFFLSPGGSSERIFLFFAKIDPTQAHGKGGGLRRENEDIKTLQVTLDDALKMLDEAKIHDAKTIIALQWLRQNRATLKDH